MKITQRNLRITRDGGSMNEGAVETIVSDIYADKVDTGFTLIETQQIVGLRDYTYKTNRGRVTTKIDDWKCTYQVTDRNGMNVGPLFTSDDVVNGRSKVVNPWVKARLVGQ